MAILSNKQTKIPSCYEIIIITQQARSKKTHINQLNNKLNTYKQALISLNELLKENKNNENLRKRILYRIQEVRMNMKKTGDIINQYLLEQRSAIQIIHENNKELLLQIKEEKRKYL